MSKIIDVPRLPQSQRFQYSLADLFVLLTTGAVISGSSVSKGQFAIIPSLCAILLVPAFMHARQFGKDYCVWSLIAVSWLLVSLGIVTRAIRAFQVLGGGFHAACLKGHFIWILLEEATASVVLCVLISFVGARPRRTLPTTSRSKTAFMVCTIVVLFDVILVVIGLELLMRQNWFVGPRHTH